MNCALKLAKRFAAANLVEEQLQRLVEEDLQSDSRYAASFVRQRISRGQGPVRIRQEMRQHRIDDLSIDEALSAEAVDWSALAEEVLRRKFGDTPAGNIHERARRDRFMRYRGFEMDHYGHLLRD